MGMRMATRFRVTRKSDGALFWGTCADWARAFDPAAFEVVAERVGVMKAARMGACSWCGAPHVIVPAPAGIGDVDRD